MAFLGIFPIIIVVFLSFSLETIRSISRYTHNPEIRFVGTSGYSQSIGGLSFRLKREKVKPREVTENRSRSPSKPEKNCRSSRHLGRDRSHFHCILIVKPEIFDGFDRSVAKETVQ
jgi:hypothetical protein